MKVKHTVRTASLVLSFLLLAQVATPRPPVVMTLVVDRSGSMSPGAPIGPCQSGTQGGRYLPSAITTFITNFDETLDRAALVSFASSSSNDVPMTAPGGLFKNNVIGTVNHLTWAGGTCAIAGLTNALRIQNATTAPTNTVKVVVFFTDGQANMTEGVFNGVPYNFGGLDPVEAGCPGFMDPGAQFFLTNTAENAQNNNVCANVCGDAPTCTGGRSISASTFTNAHGVERYLCATWITEDATNRCVLIANQLRAAGNYVYAVGLVGNPNAFAPPSLTTLQQMANDPASPTFDPTQPVGAAFLSEGNDLTNVFQQVAADIMLRVGP
jgi:hypothetical protein